MHIEKYLFILQVTGKSTWESPFNSNQPIQNNFSSRDLKALAFASSFTLQKNAFMNRSNKSFLSNSISNKWQKYFDDEGNAFYYNEVRYE